MVKGKDYESFSGSKRSLLVCKRAKVIYELLFESLYGWKEADQERGICSMRKSQCEQVLIIILMNAAEYVMRSHFIVIQGLKQRFSSTCETCW